jgi:poly(A) polymerase
MPRPWDCWSRCWPAIRAMKKPLNCLSIIDRTYPRQSAGARALCSGELFHLSRFLRACPPNREAPVTEVVRLAGLVLAPHCGYFSIARAISHQARELLLGIYRLARGRRQRGERRLLTHPMTPHALQLLSDWSQVSGEYGDEVEQWRAALGGKGQAGTVPPKDAPSKRRRRPRRRKPRGTPHPPS